MAKNVAVGIQSFEEIIQKNCFYIDKTNFIKEWWESGDKVTLIARPRRFGKTLNMSMLQQFFSVDYADRGDLFEGLSIWEDEKYRQIQGTYPVIFLSFANIKHRNFESTKQDINFLLTKLYDKYPYIRDSDKLTKNEKKYFDSVSMDMNDSIASMALHQLSDFLHRYYGEKVIIILDEYDTPMQEAYVNGYWDELVSFTRSLFNSTFKTNPYLERGLMTGITRVSKESVFSDLNNLKVVTTSSNEYATSFGFMQDEVFQALDEYGLGSEKEKVKAWYDGFTFGCHTDIYNPWSILSFIDTKGQYLAYWANTSSNSLVSKLLQRGNKKIKASFEKLLKGEAIQVPIDEQIVYNQLEDNEMAVWSLLLAGGYLKVLKKEDLVTPGVKPMYTLAITNGEVHDMFYGMVQSWFMKTEVHYTEFVQALLEGELDEMNELLSKIIRDIFSYFDTNHSEEPERFYHGLVLGLFIELHTEYILTSNRESGFGRYDVMIEPRDKTCGKYAYIMEFKVHKPRKEKTLEETLENALKQIEEKQYEADLIERGMDKDKIHKYGFAFEGKKVLIGDQDFLKRILLENS